MLTFSFLLKSWNVHHYLNTSMYSISTACRKLASKCMFACVCPCVTVNKKECFSIEPQGAEPCQHSQPQLPMPAPVVPHDPTPGRIPAKYSAFLSCCFQGKLLLSRISPHKPLNTNASTVNGLQQCEGNICNYPCFIQWQGLQPLTQWLIKKTRCCIFWLCPGIYYNWRTGWYGPGFFDRFRKKSVYLCEHVWWLHRWRSIHVFCPTTMCIRGVW